MQQIPTISQLQEEILSDLETQFQTQIPEFGKVFLRALAYVQAAKLKLFYLAAANLQKNIFVDTAEPESIGGTLERFGRVKLNRNPFSATQGEYEVSVIGTNGSVIKSETVFKSDDTAFSAGKLFVLDNNYIISGSSGTITLRALEAGLSSKLIIGDTLTATAPILGINSTATVIAEISAPIAAETIEDYRSATLDSYRLEPQGGAASDYRLWSKDAQGVKQAYAYAKSGSPSEINVFIEAKISDSVDGKGTPTNTILTDVESVIEFDPDITRPLEERGRRPLGIFLVHVLPIIPLDIDIEIIGYIGLTLPIQTDIINSITESVNSVRPYVAACDVLDTKDDIIDVNKIIASIMNAKPGSVFSQVIIKINGTPLSTFTFAGGNIPYLNSISFL